MSRSRTSPDDAAPATGPAPQARGLLIVLTAPSGTGKSTVTKRLLEVEPRLAFSVSHTTRPPRPHEQDGVDYWFVDDARFQQMVDEGAFAEWAWVHTRRYGTSHAEIERLTAAGRHVLFDVDVQGAENLLRAYPEAVSVFMLPPSLDELERRLRGRGTEDEEQVRVRLANARDEVGRCRLFEYVIINDEVEAAVADFRAILRAEACRCSRRGALIAALETQTTP